MNKKNKIFISYADADEDWVVNFINYLKIQLRKQLGDIHDGLIWAKSMIKKLENKEETITKHLKESNYLITILSPAYLKTGTIVDIEQFSNAKNIIVIEHNEVERPEKLKNTEGYFFWKKLKTGKIVQYEKNTYKSSFYQQMKEVAKDLAELLEKKTIQEKQNISPSTIRRPKIALISTHNYQTEKHSVKEYLEEKNYQVLSFKYDSPSIELKEVDYFIQLADSNIIPQNQSTLIKQQNIPIFTWPKTEFPYQNNCEGNLCPELQELKIEVLQRIKDTLIAKESSDVAIQLRDIQGSNINILGNNIEQAILSNSSKQYLGNSSLPKNSPLTFFINTIDDDRNIAKNIQAQLTKKNMNSFLSPTSTILASSKSSSETIEQMLRHNLLICDIVIITCIQAPPIWVYQQLLICIDMNLERKKLNKPNIKAVGVLNYPPPNGLDDELDIYLENLKIWECTDNLTSQCISNFIESLI